MSALTEKKSSSLIFVYAIILAFCSIIYELLFANTLSIITGDYILWHSLIIGGYIGGLGLGAHRAEKSTKDKSTLLKAELALSLFGGISVLLIYLLHSVYHVNDFYNYLGSDFYSTMYFQNNFYLKTCFFLAVEILVIFIGFLSGFEIPILMKLREEEIGREQSNIILGVSYLGTLIGSLVFALYLLPKFGLIQTSIVIASLNLVVCIWILFEEKIKNRKPFIAATIVCFFVLTVVNTNQNYITQSYLKLKYYLLHVIVKDHLDFGKFLSKLDGLPKVERTRSKYQNIDLIEMSFSATKKDIVMHLDNHYQFNSYNEEFYHEGFAHVPISLIGKKPENVLVMGGGEGLLIRELLKYPEIKQITHIELDEDVLDMGRNHPIISKLNKKSLWDPRVKTIISDAFYFLRNSKKQYDAIFLDFPYPKNLNLAKLYSIEFYRYVNNNLKDDGFLVLDGPAYNKGDQNRKENQNRVIMAPSFNKLSYEFNNVLFSSIFYAGFRKYLPYKVERESFVMAVKKPRVFDYEFKSWDRSKFNKVKLKDLQKIRYQYFPHKLEKGLVNSVFKPTILSLK